MYIIKDLYTQGERMITRCELSIYGNVRLIDLRSTFTWGVE